MKTMLVLSFDLSGMLKRIFTPFSTVYGNISELKAALEGREIEGKMQRPATGSSYTYGFMDPAGFAF